MKLKQKYLSIIPALILFLAFIYSSCSEENPVIPPPPEPPKSVTLSLVDVSCTEAFIKVTVADSVLPLNITLSRDDSPVFSFNLTNNDTTIIDTNLSPGGSYYYNAEAVINGEGWTGEKLQVKTLNTTSHNFTWQTFTFGEPSAGSSVLNDVAIIDENNIWAVGEIYADTTGQAYNAVHWDGSNWEIKRISVNFRGNLITPPLEGIFAFSSTDIWLVGSLPIHGDGNNWIIYDLRTTVDPSLSLSKAWGENTNNIYFVGRAGSIAHYQNGSWSKIESGTTTKLNDIWGVNDSSANNSLVLCTVSSRYELGDYKLLSISGNTASEYFPWPYTRLYGIWFNSPQNIYVVGDRAYVYKNNSLKSINLPTNYFLTRVKGNALNDIYISTSDAVIFHYNGINWNEMSNGIYGKYEGMDVKGNTVVFVGYNIEGGIVGKAVIIMGFQN